MLLYGKKDKTMDFSETIVVYDTKVGRCSSLNEFMNLYEYQSGPSQIQHFQISFLRNCLAKLCVEPPWDGGTKV